MRTIVRINALTLIVLAALLAVLSLQSCTVAPQKPAAERAPAPSATAEQAEKAERSGQYVRAAKEYERAAEQAAEETQRQALQLKAAETLVKAGQIYEARQKILALDTPQLDPSLRPRKLIIEAQIASQSGAPADAIRLLDEAQRSRALDPSLLALAYQVRAEAELALGNAIGAVKNLIVREQYMVNQQAIDDNQLQLWKIMTALPRASLKRELQTTSDPVLAGWLELAVVAVENAGRPALLAKATENWRRAHRGHPASAALLDKLASTKPGLIGRIDRVAVLLPLSSSNYKVAAEAVLAGIQAMDAANMDPDKPQIRVYDIGNDPTRAPAFYDQAVRDGAQFIIGPLGLEAVDQVVQQGNLTIPTLLLGHTRANQDPLPSYVFQFGLPPEQEAVQAADRAYLDGHRQAAVLYADNNWGRRMAEAFTQQWQQLGGIVLASASYDPRESDYSEPIKHLLNIVQSEARRRTLEARLGTKLEFEPRRREDIDFIFLAADAKSGRLLKPQLNYHHALNLPAYATSYIFTGKLDQVHDQDLDGIMFGDMPWMLVRDGKIEQLRQKLQTTWPYAHTELDRLFALGVDSYAIMPHLNSISSENAVRFNGVTSSLSLGRDGRLQRQLAWAKFEKGVPELLDTFINYNAQLDQLEGGTRTARASSPRS
jgi:outer membrane PBP1 activator LpoA protein